MPSVSVHSCLAFVLKFRSLEGKSSKSQLMPSQPSGQIPVQPVRISTAPTPLVRTPTLLTSLTSPSCSPGRCKSGKRERERERGGGGLDVCMFTWQRTYLNRRGWHTRNTSFKCAVLEAFLFDTTLEAQLSSAPKHMTVSKCTESPSPLPA